MYDAGGLTVEEIAGLFSVRPVHPVPSPGRPPRRLRHGRLPQHPPRQGRPDTNRRYGETGQTEKVQLEADRKWWPVGPRARPVKGIVYVADGVVDPRPRGRARRHVGARRPRLRRCPVTPPLTDAQIAEQFPTLAFAPATPGRVRGKIREYQLLATRRPDPASPADPTLPLSTCVR